MRIAIIGGNATGLAVAARLRRLSEKYKITVFEKGEVIAYGNCGFPYSLGNVIENSDELIESYPDHFLRNFNIDIRTLSEVIEVFPLRKEIKVRKNNNEEYIFEYDKLVVASGVSAVIPDIPIDYIDKSFVLRDFSDFSKIKEFIKTASPKSAVVVGTGFVGMEVVENLTKLGIRVSIIEKAERPMPWIGREFSPIISNIIKKNNIDCYCGEEILTPVNAGEGLKTTDGWKLDADMIIFATGIRPNSAFLNNKLLLDKKGYIITNKRMQTSNPHIYAVGDIASVNEQNIPFAGFGIRHAKIVANSIFGLNSRNDNMLQPYIMKFFEYSIAAIGMNEDILKKKNIKYSRIYTVIPDHVLYYPNPKNIFCKLLYDDKNGKIFGVQLFGKNGIDKRIDVFSVAMQSGMSVFELSEINLSYSPPFNNPMDLVNTIGRIAQNIKDFKLFIIAPNEISIFSDDNTLIIDIREKYETNKGMFKNAVNIPLSELRKKIKELPKDKKIILYCATGDRSYKAQMMLKNSGFKRVYNVLGGYIWAHYFSSTSCF